ncbi:hypothetical protein TWF694_008057 [Orbilia ellipsospora]|uniref:Caspase domain-containing protein n=1 Tax=Orbilia ellipsospora TaxID=2528407 RepID=A0AAV9XFL6_9PEZI
MAAQPINAVKLKEALERACEQRKINYKLVFAVALSFASDNTGAKDDSKSFTRACLELFDIIKTDVLELEFPDDMDSEDYFTFEVAPKIYHMTKSCTERKLLIIHFAGHGIVDAGGNLSIAGGMTGVPQEVRWETVKESLFGARSASHFKNMDIVFVLDCCYAGSADMTGFRDQRVVEIMAAVEGDKKTNERLTARPSIGQKSAQPSFTQRIINNMRLAVSQQPAGIAMREIFDSMVSRRSDRGTPVYHTVRGSRGVFIPGRTTRLPGLVRDVRESPSALAASRWAPPTYRIAMMIHADGSIDDTDTQELVRWLQSLASKFGVEVTSVHKTQSTVIFVTVPGQHYHDLLETQNVLPTLIRDAQPGSSAGTPST